MIRAPRDLDTQAHAGERQCSCAAGSDTGSAAIVRKMPGLPDPFYFVATMLMGISLQGV